MDCKTVIDNIAAAMVAAGYTRSPYLAHDLGEQVDQLANSNIEKTFVLDYGINNIEERASKTYAYSIACDVLVFRKIGTINQGTRPIDIDNCFNESHHIIDHLGNVDTGGQYRKPDSVILDGTGEDFAIFKIPLSVKLTRQNTHV